MLLLTVSAGASLIHSVEGKLKAPKINDSFVLRDYFLHTTGTAPTPPSYRPPCCYRGSNKMLWVAKMLASVFSILF